MSDRRSFTCFVHLHLSHEMALCLRTGFFPPLYSLELFQDLILSLGKELLMPTSSTARKLMTRAGFAYARWINKKAKYPGDWSGAVEIAGGDVSRSELPSPQRVNVSSRHEMFVSFPFGTAEIGSDRLDSSKLDSQASVTSPSIDLFDASDPIDLEMPTMDPVYSTAELRDRASSIMVDVHTATSFQTSQDLQADSSCGKTLPGTDTRREYDTKSPHLLDEPRARGPLNYCYEEIADINPSTSSLGLDSPMPQIASETQLHGRPAKLRTNTTSASDSTRYHWCSSSERRQIPVQVQKRGAEANHDHGSYLGANPARSRTQVEELRGLVRIVSNEWMQRLVPRPELHTRCSSLSARTLFAKGIDTLKTWLCGRLGRTFEEVFSFMHIAFAAAFILHHGDDSYYWDGFFQEAFQLQHALVDREEKLLFLTVMDCWWWLPGQQSTYILILIFPDCCQDLASSHVPAA